MAKTNSITEQAALYAQADKMRDALRFIVTELTQHPDHGAPKNPVMYALNRARDVLASLAA